MKYIFSKVRPSDISGILKDYQNIIAKYRLMMFSEFVKERKHDSFWTNLIRYELIINGEEQVHEYPNNQYLWYSTRGELKRFYCKINKIGRRGIDRMISEHGDVDEIDSLLIDSWKLLSEIYQISSCSEYVKQAIENWGKHIVKIDVKNEARVVYVGDGEINFSPNDEYEEYNEAVNSILDLEDEEYLKRIIYDYEDKNVLYDNKLTEIPFIISEYIFAVKLKLSSNESNVQLEGKKKNYYFSSDIVSSIFKNEGVIDFSIADAKRQAFYEMIHYIENKIKKNTYLSNAKTYFELPSFYEQKYISEKG